MKKQIRRLNTINLWKTSIRKDGKIPNKRNGYLQKDASYQGQKRKSQA